MSFALLVSTGMLTLARSFALAVILNSNKAGGAVHRLSPLCRHPLGANSTPRRSFSSLFSIPISPDLYSCTLSPYPSLLTRNYKSTETRSPIQRKYSLNTPLSHSRSSVSRTPMSVITRWPRSFFWIAKSWITPLDDDRPWFGC